MTEEQAERVAKSLEVIASCLETIAGSLMEDGTIDSAIRFVGQNLAGPHGESLGEVIADKE